jgi:uridine phosphorylase
MGGPNAALVLDDLAELGLRRGVRIGTCTALGDEPRLGELLVVSEAIPWPRIGGRDSVRPDPSLTAALAAELGDTARSGAVASLDTLPGNGAEAAAPATVADMQTATLLARGAELGVELAAVLIVAASESGALGDETTATAAKWAGTAARAILSG